MAGRWALLALFVVGCQSWELPAVPAGRRAQFYTRQSDGAYKYGFDTDEGAYQLQHADDVNEVRGQYGADGGRIEYTAGVGGFKVISETKPRATGRRRYNTAPVRETTLDELTRPVVDTPAVAAAKAKFQRDYQRAAAAAAAAPDINIITGAVPVIVDQPPRDPAYDDVRYYGPPAPLGPDGNVEDTPEVKAAKARILVAQQAAARKAAAAPNRNIITGAVPVIVDRPVVRDNGLRYTGPLASLDAEGNVRETPEVAAAKASFQTAYNSAAAIAAAAPDINIITAPSRAAHAAAEAERTHAAAAAARRTHAAAVSAAAAARRTHTSSASRTAYRAPSHSKPVIPAVVRLDAAGNLADTPEVAAAKASFRAAYDRAAAAAAAAPDRNIITARPSAGRGVYSSSSHRQASSGHSSHRQASAGHHGVTRQYRVNGVTVQESDGASSPSKYGYAYE